MKRQAITTTAAPTPAGPYSQAIVAGDFVFCSGTVGVDASTGQVREGIEAQTEQAITNLAAILREAGSSLDQLVKTTIFYSDAADYSRMNAVYERHMPDPPPARSAPANITLPNGLLISIDAIATLSD